MEKQTASGAMKKIFLTLILLLSACENYQWGATETGALGGAAAGAGLGAIIGSQTGHAGPGVAIGSAVGALGGGLIGNQIDRTDKRIDDRERQIESQGRAIEENRRMLEELRQRGIDVRDSRRGIVINLPDVLFQFGRADLTPRARDTIEEIADVLLKAPSRRLLIEGHTDNIGTIEYNYRLSDSRARNVANELKNNGVSDRIIRTRALGETEPIATNRTEEGRKRNRRVEVIVEK